MPERLAREYIAQVNFDERHAHRQEGVAQRDAGVGEGTWIDDHETDRLAFRCLYFADQLVLGIALPGNQFMALGNTLPLELRLNVLQSGRAIDCRLASAEQIQIRAIEQ